ncbi:hypothetical protein BFW38_07770 [Terasakiispira papahanaumokuakeensis]|uniref:Uncharacterized protein n=1 Tax=Terasakiispira papahanaumokuakeensis TaxID=197479 RepID=A0A1E2V8X3_9GAMM|nr:hypothetical protein BFW38_07770 [Terasakiispira papahanaumokuakeensis]
MNATLIIGDHAISFNDRVQCKHAQKRLSKSDVKRRYEEILLKILGMQVLFGRGELDSGAPVILKSRQKKANP